MATKNYTRQIIDDYCVVDTETTGLSAYYDEIIEIGILRVRENQIIDKYVQLLKPEQRIDSFITSLTGITNEMVRDKPSVKSVKNDVLEILGDDIIVGHNTSFDIRFLEAAFACRLPNKYIDTMQFARKLFPELKHHGLTDLTAHLGLQNNEHRALADCLATKDLYDAIKNVMKERELKIEDLWVKHKDGIDIDAIQAETTGFDEDNFFFNRHVVFTGKLEKMIRKEAMQLVVNLGGVLDKSVNRETNYLILGNNDYNPALRGNKSSKQLKAEKLRLEGYDIQIIDEFTFYDLLKE